MCVCVNEVIKRPQTKQKRRENQEHFQLHRNVILWHSIILSQSIVRVSYQLAQCNGINNKTKRTKNK